MSSATENFFRLPAKYSPSSRSVFTSTGWRSSSTISPSRTRLGLAQNLRPYWHLLLLVLRHKLSTPKPGLSALIFLAVDRFPPSIAATLRNSPTSVAGNASISRTARSAIYCAVHSPIPRTPRSRVTVSSMLPNGRKRFGSATAASAKAFSVASRAPGIPNPIELAAASRFAVGNTRANSGCSKNDLGTDRPCNATSCPASRRAAVTLICCPSTARTASSNPSQAPGARSPGLSATRGASSGSPDKCSPIVSISAPRSNSRRTRATIAGSSRTSETVCSPPNSAAPAGASPRCSPSRRPPPLSADSARPPPPQLPEPHAPAENPACTPSRTAACSAAAAPRPSHPAAPRSSCATRLAVGGTAPKTSH